MSYKHTILLVLILFLACLIRVCLSPQYFGLDDTAYLYWADQYARGEADLHSTYLCRFRIGMYIPLGLLIWLGWLQPCDFWILTVTADILTLFCLFRICLFLFGTFAAITASFLYAIYPLSVLQSTMYYPTSFKLLFLSLSFLLFLKSGEKNNLRYAFLTFLAGIILGLGYLIKEDIALFFIALMFSAIVTRFTRWRMLIYYAIGFVLVLIIESIWYWFQEGDFLFRIHQTSGQIAPVDISLPYSVHWGGLSYIWGLFLLPYEVGIYWWLLIPAIVTSLFQRDKKLIFVLFCFIIEALYLQFGTGSFYFYQPLPKSPYYSTLVTPFMIIILSWWISYLWQMNKKVLGCSILILNTFISLICIMFFCFSASELTRNVLAVVPYLKEKNIHIIWTDYYSARLISLLAGERIVPMILFHADFKNNQIQMNISLEELKGSYVFLDHQYERIYSSFYNISMPVGLQQASARWNLVWRHHSYPEEGISRNVLLFLIHYAEKFPVNIISKRIMTFLNGMIKNDEAFLYSIPTG